jgi:hypothetical protein
MWRLAGAMGKNVREVASVSEKKLQGWMGNTCLLDHRVGIFYVWVLFRHGTSHTDRRDNRCTVKNNRYIYFFGGSPVASFLYRRPNG